MSKRSFIKKSFIKIVNDHHNGLAADRLLVAYSRLQGNNIEPEKVLGSNYSVLQFIRDELSENIRVEIDTSTQELLLYPIIKDDIGSNSDIDVPSTENGTLYNKISNSTNNQPDDNQSHTQNNENDQPFKTINLNKMKREDNKQTSTNRHSSQNPFRKRESNNQSRLSDISVPSDESSANGSPIVHKQMTKSEFFRKLNAEENSQFEPKSTSSPKTRNHQPIDDELSGKLTTSFQTAVSRRSRSYRYSSNNSSNTKVSKPVVNAEVDPWKDVLNDAKSAEISKPERSKDVEVEVAKTENLKDMTKAEVDEHKDDASEDTYALAMSFYESCTTDAESSDASINAAPLEEEKHISKVEAIQRSILQSQDNETQSDAKTAKNASNVNTQSKQVHESCVSQEKSANAKFDEMNNSRSTRGILPKCVMTELKVGNKADCILSEVNNPLKFWVRLQKYETHFNSLIDDMAEFYNDPVNATENIVSEADVCENELYAAISYHKLWYRVSLIEKRSSELFLIRYVDTGALEKVFLKDLRRLDVQFLQLPTQAICCALNDVRPIGSFFTSDIALYFMHLMENEDLTLTVCGINKVFKLYVDIIIKETNTHVNKKLIELGMAKFGR